ncbi:hypothetical protein [Longimicrobium sp.]|jgi:hypothetical protein|uniref:hypothetical protein n=1 Tax=Longimicrobium sp. TaxID=2029185 RepID=UPI002ED8B001
MHIRHILIGAAAAAALGADAAPAQAQLLAHVRARVRQQVEHAADQAANAVENRIRGAGSSTSAADPAQAAPAAAPSASPESPARAQSASRSVGADSLPVRPARRAALATPFVDADLAWILPLLSAQAADMRRGTNQLAAEIDVLRSVMTPEAGEARVARIRSGQVHAMDEVRAFSAQAAVPASARYQAGCSAGLTEAMGGLMVSAVFTGASVEEARAFYVGRGWRWTGQWDLGYQVRSPDGRLLIMMNDPRGFGPAAAVKIGRDAREGRMPGYDAYIPCADLDGAVMIMQVEARGEGGELAVRVNQAGAAAVQSSAERLPSALRQAGLTTEEWNQVVTMIWEAATDDMFAANRAGLDAAAGSKAAGDRRRANVAWYTRNQAVIDPAVQATTAS